MQVNSSPSERDAVQMLDQMVGCLAFHAVLLVLKRRTKASPDQLVADLVEYGSHRDQIANLLTKTQQVAPLESVLHTGTAPLVERMRLIDDLVAGKSDDLHAVSEFAKPFLALFEGKTVATS